MGYLLQINLSSDSKRNIMTEKKGKKQMVGRPDYMPGKSLQKRQNNQDKQDIELAKLLLENPKTTSILQLLTRRLFELIKAQAILNLLKIHHEPLNHSNIEQLIANDELQLEINRLLTKVVGEKNDPQARIEEGNLNESGYFGMNPQAIRNVIFKKGNFREQIYILYRDGYSGFSNEIFSDKTMIDQVNHVLAITNADWAIDKKEIAAICKESQSKSPYTRGIYSRFVRDEKLRVERSEEEKQMWTTKNNPKINDNQKRLFPLSEREKIVKTGEFPSSALYQYLANKQDPYISGSAFYKKAETKHPFLDLYQQIGEEFYAGASGITDTILTFALCVGCSDKEDLKALRDAACISMIEDKSHSPHEVFFAAKSFGLPYMPGELYPNLHQSVPESNDKGSAPKKKPLT